MVILRVVRRVTYHATIDLLPEDLKSNNYNLYIYNCKKKKKLNGWKQGVAAKGEATPVTTKRK